MTNPSPEPLPSVPMVPQPPVRTFVNPQPGEVVTSLNTGNTYTIGDKIGEGNFGQVFACSDGWDNDLAVKVLKPSGTYEEVRDRAMAEVQKLFALRHPNVTYVYDAFEYRDTFYIVTERCHFSGHDLFRLPGFVGKLRVMPIARSVLQAVHYLHLSGYVHQDIHPGNVFVRIARNEFLKEPLPGMRFKFAPTQRLSYGAT